MLKTIANWLLRRAIRTPYFHLYHADGSTYMERFWLVPFGNSTKHGCWTATWRQPFTWLCQKLDISIRLHWIHTPDLDRALHDHPWTFLSVVLIGSYTEERPTTPEKTEFNVYAEPFDMPVPDGRLTLEMAARLVNPPLVAVEREHVQRSLRGPGSVALRRFYHRHRISAVSPGGVLTLFVSFRKRQSWGFFTPQGKTWWWVFESVHNNKPITAKAP